MKIYSRILVSFLTPILISVIILGLFSYVSFRQRLLAMRIQESESLLSYSSYEMQDLIYFLDVDKLRDATDNLMKNKEIQKVYIMKPDASIIVDSNSVLKFSEISDDRFTNKAKEAAEFIYELRGGILYTARPIYLSGEKLGIVRIDFILEDIYSILSRQLYTFFAMSIISISICLLSGFFITRAILKPVKELHAATEQISLGKLDIKSDITSGDELGDFEIAFNNMVKELKNSRDEVHEKSKELESAKKELEDKNNELIQTLEDFYTLRLGMAKDIEIGKVKEENRKVKARLDKLKKTKKRDKSEKNS